jgi:deoxyinosine 3'endonuclease (endonuclease V)
VGRALSAFASFEGVKMRKPSISVPKMLLSKKFKNEVLIMGNVEKSLIRQARSEYKKIFPCSHREKLEHCITRDKERVYLWFNTEDQSTHVLTKKIR